MPLLPGETRETDRYVSGLSFIDDFGRTVKTAAQRTQVGPRVHMHAAPSMPARALHSANVV